MRWGPWSLAQERRALPSVHPYPKELDVGALGGETAAGSSSVLLSSAPSPNRKHAVMKPPRPQAPVVPLGTSGEEPLA